MGADKDSVQRVTKAPEQAPNARGCSVIDMQVSPGTLALSCFGALCLFAGSVSAAPSGPPQGSGSGEAAEPRAAGELAAARPRSESRSTAVEAAEAPPAPALESSAASDASPAPGSQQAPAESRIARVAGPPALSSFERPPPVPPPPTAARRAFELIPGVGFALPHCVERGGTRELCEGVRGGLGISAGVLWRVVPYFAWGGALGVDVFRYRPPAALAGDESRAFGAKVHVLARVYWNEEGPIDPYVQLGLGGAVLGTTIVADGTTTERSGAGASVELEGGVGFALSRSVRLGPSLAYTHVVVDRVRVSEVDSDADALDLDASRTGHLDGVLRLGAQLTIAFGDEL